MAAAIYVNNLSVGLSKKIKCVLIVPIFQTKSYDPMFMEGRKASKSRAHLDSDMQSHVLTYTLQL